MIQVVGQNQAGRDVAQITIQRDGLTASILSYGAILQSLHLAGHDRNLVLGYPHIDHYLSDPNYFGATIGRVANRIGQGAVSIGGTQYQLDQNGAGGHHLHGGSDGTGCRLWCVTEHTQSQVILQDCLPDGHMGYPGTMTVEVCFSILPEQILSVEITAQADALTLCNFAHHSYFNLGARDTIKGHRLQVFADRYLVVDAHGVPTGEIRNVRQSRFDFQSGRRLETVQGYDHNMCLADVRGPLNHAACLIAPDGIVRMDILTTEPGLQIYTGQGIRGAAHATDLQPYKKFAGIALEPQSWPDAANNDSFPSTVLAPQEVYSQTSQYKLSINEIPQI